MRVIIVAPLVLLAWACSVGARTASAAADSPTVTVASGGGGSPVIFGYFGHLEAIGYEREEYFVSGHAHSYETAEPDEMVEAVRTGRAKQVLDVRAPAEWADGHLAGSVHRYTGDLPAGIPSELSKDEAVWVGCASGFRASIAASLLQRAGYRPILLRSGGIPDVLERLAQAPARS